MRSEKSKSSLWLILPLFLTVSCNYQLEVHQKRDQGNVISTATPVPYTQMFESMPFQQTSGDFLGNCIAIDPSDGSRYVASILSSGSITIGSNTYISGGYDKITLTKQDRSGTLLWSKFIDGNNDGPVTIFQGLSSCLTLVDGKVFLAFLSQTSSVTIDSFTDTKIGALDSYLVGFNANNGELTYHRHFGQTGQVAEIVSIASSGNTVYWAGVTQDDSLPGPSASCSSGCISYGAIDVANEENLWERRWGGGVSFGFSIATGKNQDLYLAGIYQSSGIDIGTGSTFDSPTSTSSFLEKVSALDGSPVWIRRVTATTGVAESLSVQTDDHSNAYFTTMTDDTSLDFEGQTVPVISNSGLITSYDSDGNFRWATDFPENIVPAQSIYDSKYKKLFVVDNSSDSTSMPIMSELDPNDGTILKTIEGTSISGGILKGMTIALDQNNSSFMIIATLSGSVEIDGTTYTASSSMNQTVFFEWK